MVTSCRIGVAIGREKTRVSTNETRVFLKRATENAVAAAFIMLIS